MSPEREPRTANREALVKAALKFLAASKMDGATLRQVVLVVEDDDGVRGRLTLDLDRLSQDMLSRELQCPATAAPSEARATDSGPRGTFPRRP
jgi:hypothetical protein